MSNQKEETPASSWIFGLTVPLWLVYVSNQWSRASIYYLVDFSNDATEFNAMNTDIGFNEAQYGILASVAFTSLFAIASVLAGVAADKLNRKTLTTVSALSWSAATLVTALSQSYSQVVLARVAMGLACAFSTPTAYTLIRERAPKEKASLATSLYGTGVAVASAFASLSILLDTEFGWRNTLFIISAFGLASSVINTLVLADDPKQEQDEKVDADVLSGFSEVLAVDRVRWIFLASFLRFCSGLCIGVWGAPYFRQAFGDRQSDYAVAQAAISAVGASISGLIGGSTADWLASQNQDKDPVGSKLLVPIVGSLLAVPTWYFALNSEGSFETAMIWLAAEYFVAECWFGPTISSLQSSVGSRVGGTAQGMFTLTGAIANLAPSLLGYIYSQSSQVNEQTASLSTILSSAVCAFYLSSAACFSVALFASPKEKTP